METVPVETARVINKRKRKFDTFSVEEDNDNNEVDNSMSLYRNEPLSDDISLTGYSSVFRSDIETINKSRDGGVVEEGWQMGEEEEAIPGENNNEEVRSEAKKEC